MSPGVFIFPGDHLVDSRELARGEERLVFAEAVDNGERPFEARFLELPKE